MAQQKTAAAPEQMTEEELLDSTVELIRAYQAIKDPDKRKELRAFALHLAGGGTIQ
jgi:hypothetical protein